LQAKTGGKKSQKSMKNLEKNCLLRHSATIVTLLLASSESGRARCASATTIRKHVEYQ